MYRRNHHNLVNQPYFNKTFKNATINRKKKGHAVGAYTGRQCIYTYKMKEKGGKYAIIFAVKYHIQRLKKCCGSNNRVRSKDTMLGLARRVTQ